MTKLALGVQLSDSFGQGLEASGKALGFQSLAKGVTQLNTLVLGDMFAQRRITKLARVCIVSHSNAWPKE